MPTFTRLFRVRTDSATAPDRLSEPIAGDTCSTPFSSWMEQMPPGVITQIPSSARGWIHKAGNDGFIKLVADARRGVLVGATSAGPAGGEVLGALVVAIHGQVPVSLLETMIYAYPTFHRAISDALRDLDKKVSPA